MKVTPRLGQDWSLFVYNHVTGSTHKCLPADAMRPANINPHSAASGHDCDTGRAQRTSPSVFNIIINNTDCRVYKYYTICIYF